MSSSTQLSLPVRTWGMLVPWAQRAPGPVPAPWRREASSWTSFHTYSCGPELPGFTILENKSTRELSLVSATKTRPDPAIVSTIEEAVFGETTGTPVHCAPLALQVPVMLDPVWSKRLQQPHLERGRVIVGPDPTDVGPYRVEMRISLTNADSRHKRQAPSTFGLVTLVPMTFRGTNGEPRKNFYATDARAVWIEPPARLARLLALAASKLLDFTACYGEVDFDGRGTFSSNVRPGRSRLTNPVFDIPIISASGTKTVRVPATLPGWST